ncbi:glycosyltransferase 52 family protein [Vibrio campbellii]
MNLFVVTSPFQYICANEARLSYNLNKNILIYVEQNTESGIHQMEALFDQNCWDSVIRIQRANRTFSVPKAIRKAKAILKGKTVNNLIFSEYSGWRTNLILANITAENYIYIDDGTATLLEYDDCIAPNKPYTRSRSLQDLLIRLQQLSPPQQRTPNERLELFSIFDFDDNKVKYRRNNLDGLRTFIDIDKVFSINAPVGLIGQACIGEKRGISTDEYVQDLQKISKEQKNGILYFPHRTESPEVKNRVKAISGLHYHTPSAPIELEISLADIQLSGVIGVTSTALYTVSKIYSSLPIKVLGGELKGNNDRDARVRQFLNGYFQSYYAK